MSARKRVAIFGTFDVANYGDLLFPMVARHELQKRLGDFELVPFSYSAESANKWPFEVFALESFFAQVQSFDAVIIGGGHLVRFEKFIAPGYQPKSAAIHHPSGYWLAPALAALAVSVPVIWNAPSASPDVPRWARPLLRLALEQSDYVSVRDENSRDALRRVSNDAAIELVPDTLTGLKSLHLASAFCAFPFELPEPYWVVQANDELNPLIAAARAHPLLREANLVEVPVGPILGDKVGHLGQSGREYRVANWKHPLEVTALIAGSSGVIARSLHCSLTGLVFGKPVLTPDLAAGSKYSFLGGSERMFIGADDETLTRFARAQPLPGPEPFIERSLARLETHWDRIAALVSQGRAPERSRPAVHALTFELPIHLERGALAERALRELKAQHAQTSAELARLSADRQQLLTNLAARDEQLAQSHAQQVHAAERAQELLAEQRAEADAVLAQERAERAQERAERAQLLARLDCAQAEAEGLKHRLTDAELQLKGLREHDELAFQRIEHVSHSRVWGLLGKVRHAQSLIFRTAEERKQEKLIRESGLFDEAWYLKENPDVALRGVDAAHHYLIWGAAEGRDPSPHFHSAHYLRAYPDVARSGMHPLIHYLIWGRAEGRAPTDRSGVDKNGSLRVPDGQRALRR